jgi:hypothetical protein
MLQYSLLLPPPERLQEHRIGPLAVDDFSAAAAGREQRYGKADHHRHALAGRFVREHVEELNLRKQNRRGGLKTRIKLGVEGKVGEDSCGKTSRSSTCARTRFGGRGCF